MNLTAAAKQVFATASAFEKRVLRILAQHSASAGEIAEEMGTAVVTVNSAVGRIGHRVFDLTNHHPGNGSGFYGVICIGRVVEGRGYVWTLRADVVRAIE